MGTNYPEPADNSDYEDKNHEAVSIGNDRNLSGKLCVLGPGRSTDQPEDSHFGTERAIDCSTQGHGLRLVSGQGYRLRRDRPAVVPDGARDRSKVANEAYTKGETVALGSEVFLVAYREPGFERATFRRMGGPYPMVLKAPERFTPDTTLELSLINVHSLGALEGIRGVNVDELIAAHNKEADRQQALYDRSMQQISMQTLYRLASMVNTSGGRFQPIPAEGIISSDPGVVIDSDEPASYGTNAALAGKSIRDLKDPSHVILYYILKPFYDGTRGVVFANGQVAQLRPEQWTRIKAQNKLTAP